MSSRKNRRRKDKIDRRELARSSQVRLIKILENPSEHHRKVVQSSVLHLVKISQRHRIPIPLRARHLFCRQCLSPYRYGENARVRIRAGQRTLTCMECTSVRRYGGGPKSHRKTDSSHS